MTDEGRPNGHFFIVKKQARELAKEVVETHLGKNKTQAEEYLKKKFEETWEHYDVNNEGVMDANWVSTFMRALCKSENQHIDL